VGKKDEKHEWVNSGKTKMHESDECAEKALPI
jgi:hypothetical protein